LDALLQGIGTQYDWRILIAGVVGCAISLAGAFYVHAAARGAPVWRRRFWLALAGLTAGSGVWATHAVTTLASKARVPIDYQTGWTLASFAVVVAGITLGLAMGASPQRKRSNRAAAAGGALIGLSIGAMHYLAIRGYHVHGDLTWDVGGVAASLGLVVSFAALAMAAAGPEANRVQRAAATGLLLIAVLGMHFTAEGSLIVIPAPSDHLPHATLSARTVAILASAVGGLVFFIAMAWVAIDAVNRDAAARRLRQALDAMPEGVAVFDAADRLMIWNDRYAGVYLGAGVTLAKGKTFRELLEEGLAAGNPVRTAEAQSWLEERLAVRKGERESIVFPTRSGRWVQVSDRRMPDGGMVSTCIDVTKLKDAEIGLRTARDQAQRLATLADQAEALARIGHWRVDLTTRAYEWSPGFIQIYGLPPGARMDVDTIMAMLHPDDVQKGAEFLRRRLAGEAADDIAVIRIIQPSGDVRFLHSRIDVERDEEGQPVTALGTVVDVTEATLAELAVAESETRFRNLAANAPDIIVESGPDRTLTYISPACEAITGYRPEELLGGGLAGIINPDDLGPLAAMCEALIWSKGAFRTQPIEFRATHRSGETLWLESQPTYIADPVTGRHLGFIDVIHDVTPRKRLETELRAARAEAEAAAAVKADFLANLTHELRTPLTSIIGFTAMTAQEEGLSPKARHGVERVAEASHALLCTVNDLLDFSKLEAGQVAIRPEPVQLGSLARGTLDLFAPQAEAKDLRLSLDLDQPETVVAVDPDRMRQVLLNLIGNALKFTAAGGVTLRMRYDNAQRSLAAEVVDTGDGIPQAKLEQLFKRFSQVDGSLTRVQGGTGLGLAICKGLVEAMGGEIGVESREGKGSRFWFRIPALPAIAARPAAASEPADGAALDGLQVLVVDDNPANRELARLILTGAGAAVAEAEDGEVAVDVTSGRRFDVILMDMRMPRLDGPAALQRIRATKGPNAATPVIAFTADFSGDATAELRAQGFDGGVAKPLDAAALMEAVAAAAAGASEPVAVGVAVAAKPA
jgi:PAS domain S-box-containing protein